MLRDLRLRWCLYPVRSITLVMLTYGLTWYLLGRIESRALSALAGAFLLGSFFYLGLAYLSLGDELQRTIRRFVAGRWKGESA